MVACTRCTQAHSAQHQVIVRIGLRLSLACPCGSSGLGPKTGPGIFQVGQPTQIMRMRVLLLIRPPDIDMSKGLNLYCCNLFLPDSYPILLHRAAAAHQNVYHRFGRRLYSILSLSILPRPSPNFYRGSKSETWPRSSTQLFFERLLFRNEATHSYQCNLFWCSNDGALFSPNLV